MIRLKLRFDFPDGTGLGRGKIELLEQIGRSGSISAGGRALGMSYRRAWLLIASLNQAFRKPVVETAHGGEHGGGALLTPFGREVIRRFHGMERRAHRAAMPDLKALGAALAAGPAKKPRGAKRAARRAKLR